MRKSQSILSILAALAGLALTQGCRATVPGEEDDNEALNAAGSCGVERWSIKTGTDSAASSVNMTPQDTGIATLRGLPTPPGLRSGSPRFANTAETQVWRLSNVTLVEYKLENDSDYHLVLKDAAGNTMIAEIPSPSCVSGGPWAAAITAARNAMNTKYTVTSSFQTANVPVTITGAGFFDLLHGQTGVAPNGIELHAILSLCFVGSSVSGCGSTADFSLAANPASLSSGQGASASSSITVGAVNGFSGSVLLSASGLPAGASASFSASSIGAGASSTLTLSAGSAPAGTYAVTVTGTSGSLTHSANLSWTITSAGPTPDFALSASPASVSTAPGGSATSAISAAALNGFMDSVSLIASGAPAGASATLSTANLTAGGSATLTLSSGSAAPGTYAVDVTGTSGSVTHSLQVGWTIASAGGGNVIVNGGFESGLASWTSAGTTSATSVSHSGSGAAQVGSTTATSLSSLSQTFTVPAGAGALSFYYQGVCNDTVTYAWAIATLKDNTAGTTATLRPKKCTKTGAWVQVTSGALTAGHSMTLTLSNQGEVYKTQYGYTLYDDVQLSGGAPAPDFTFAESPATVTTATGASGSATATVGALNGFADTVTLSASGLPPGASASFNPASISGSGSATVTLSAGSAAPGTYAITLSGASSTLTHTASLSWTLTSSASPDFSLTAAQGAVTSSSGAAATDSISVSPSGGFASSVALSVSGLPAGTSGSFSPGSIPGGNGSSTLTLTPGSAAPGTYPLTLTGSGGGLTHTAPLSWTVSTPVTTGIQTVFLILMENHNWSQIGGSSSAPYLNNTLLPQASYALNYQNPAGNHPSEPNYLWLEAGTNFGIKSDGLPARDHQSTSQHLVTLLQNAGISWRSYQEGISGSNCPLTTVGGSNGYAPKHNPMVYFDDVTNSNNANSANCIAHVRPYTELATDLQNNSQARYNFITPNLCDDMHNSTGCSPTTDAVKNGDTWLSNNIPPILNSAAYQNGGVIFITWDESEGGDVPVGMIVLSAKAKGNGYTNSISYTHSSTLRSLEEIFGVSPFLGDAANATDLQDLFTSFP